MVSPPRIISQMGEGGRIGKATLEMELQGQAPQGVISTSDGLRLPFTGWTELASALEEWRARALLDGLGPRSGKSRTADETTHAQPSKET